MNLAFRGEGGPVSPRFPPPPHHTLALALFVCRSVNWGRGISVLGEVTGGGQAEWLGVNVCCCLGRSNVAGGEVASQAPEF